jgi:HSP20 family protein
MAAGMTRWEPFAELAELRDRLDRAFGEISGGEARTWAPRVDVVREKERIVVQAELPGIKPEEVEISVEGDVLTISGHHEQNKEEKDEHVVRCERRYGSFSRSMPLPSGVDPDQIEADFADGVLEVSIPVPAEKEAKRVEIKPRVRE